MNRVFPVARATAFWSWSRARVRAIDSPILRHEARSRFRSIVPFLVIGFLTASVSLGLLLRWVAFEASLLSGASNMDATAFDAIGTQGREFFWVGMLVQGPALFFLGALLTAGSIAREREMELLEALQLTPFPAWKQVISRLLGAMGFLALTVVCIAPLWMILLMLGGLGPGEVVLGMATCLAGGTWGAALGLWLSARSHRPSNAFAATITMLTVMTAFSVFVFNTAQPWAAYDPKVYLLGSLHPFGLLSILGGAELGGAVGRGFVLFTNQQALTNTLGIWGLTGILALCSAARWSARALPAPSWRANPAWIEKWKQRLDASEAGSVAAPSPVPAAEPTLELAAGPIFGAEPSALDAGARDEVARSSSGLGAERERGAGRPAVKDRVARQLVSDLPIEVLARFPNPVMAREVRARLRLRAGTIWLEMARWFIMIVAAGVWMWLAFTFIPAHERSFGIVTTWILIWLLGCVIAGTVASQSIVRERQSGTWRDLRTSLLGARLIVMGKLGAAVVLAFYCSAPFLLLQGLLLALSIADETSAHILADESLLLRVLLMIVSSWALMAAFGLFFSWLMARPVSAWFAWAISGIAIFYLAPALHAWAFPPSSTQEIMLGMVSQNMDWIRLSPLTNLVELNSRRGSFSIQPHFFLLTSYWQLALSLGLLWWLTARVRKEKERL